MQETPTPRIAPVGEVSAEVAEILSTALTHDGRPLNIFGVLASAGVQLDPGVPGFPDDAAAGVVTAP